MNDAKDVILGRVREALQDRPTPEPVERTYRRVSEMSREEVVEQLVDRLVDYKANVYREDVGSVAGRVAELLADARTYVVPPGLDEAWLPEDESVTATEGFALPEGEGRVRIVEPTVGDAGALGVRVLNEVGAVVTSSTVSCSETGTIFLSGRPDEGRRAISLVPDHHVCIVPLDSIVELIPESLERLEPTATITMISGPSATSDIELERVEGVHGPRRLDVILLDRP
ncbi:LutC/YkgG family protein [Micrococcus sp.]|uniref:LutC/YkgG family protein n=1 Tax=Micrococcus sp. TaxID=1271 RepID=UPI002A912E8E|nr:LUD domain-containing protein [Micrococcus sp.]MDY6054751.1 LUD domain-containing protein [Micrococcus sp.]